MNLYKDLTIQEVKSHSDHRTFIIENTNGSFMEANEITATLLICLKDSSDEKDGINKFCTIYPNLDRSVINSFINDKLSQIMTSMPTRSNMFIYQKLILNGHIVDSISRNLTFLFNREIGCSCFFISLILDIIFLTLSPNLLGFSNNIDATIIIGLIIAIISSSLIHEFGHAAAARKFGLHTGGIGLGLYINFPVFYTDVTCIWRLPKAQKCIVNLAGIYFQLLIIVPVIIIYEITGLEILKYFVIATNFSFILNLNPFFRLDGYWLISDIAEVPNLRKRSRELLKYIIAKILKYPVSRTPYLLQLKGCTRYSLLIYSIVVNLFMAYYFFYIIPMFIWNFALNMPKLIKQLIICLSNNIMPPFALTHNLISEILFFLIIAFMLYRLIYNYASRRSKNNTAR